MLEGDVHNYIDETVYPQQKTVMSGECVVMMVISGGGDDICRLAKTVDVEIRCFSFVCTYFVLDDNINT